jgi:hypothetical protein
VKKQLEELGRLIDKLDNINEASKIPISAELHLAGLKDAIPNIRKELFGIYTALGGEDVWGSS